MISNSTTGQQVTTERDAHYIRILVENNGRQIANQCRAYLVNVEKWNDKKNKFEQSIYCDSLQLAWSAQGNNADAFRPIDLPPNIKQFIDVFSTAEKQADYDIKLKTRLNRYVNLFQEHGKLRYTVQVSGDNVKPKTTKIIFIWNGKWDDFSVNSG